MSFNVLEDLWALRKPRLLDPLDFHQDCQRASFGRRQRYQWSVSSKRHLAARIATSTIEVFSNGLGGQPAGQTWQMLMFASGAPLDASHVQP